MRELEVAPGGARYAANQVSYSPRECGVEFDTAALAARTLDATHGLLPA